MFFVNITMLAIVVIICCIVNNRDTVNALEQQELKEIDVVNVAEVVSNNEYEIVGNIQYANPEHIEDINK